MTRRVGRLDLPLTLLRIGFAEALAYRGELVIWLLTTNMPLIMLLLWSTVAAEAPVGRYGQREFTAYFLTILVVRLLTGGWVVWQMNMEIRNGQIAMRMLRPLHPFVGYAAEHFGAWPLRAMWCLPIAAVAVVVVGVSAYTADPWQWLVFAAALFGAWALNFAAMLAIGCLAFFWQSSLSLFEVWFRLYIVLSGYVVPLDLFPEGLRAWVAYLPFRYLLAFPVEVALGTLSLPAAVADLARQWLFILGFTVLAGLLWRRGAARYEAFGG